MPDETQPGADTPPPAEDKDDAAEIQELVSILDELYKEDAETLAPPTGSEAAPADASLPDAPAASDSPAPIDWTTPEARAVLDQWYTDRKAAETRQDSETASLQEIAKLVQEGKHQELGEIVAKELVSASQREVVGKEVLTNFLSQTYQKIFADPVFQSLTDAEKIEIDPKRFPSDVEYIDFLRQFTARKSGAQATDEVIEAKVQERLKAAANENRGRKMTTSSPTGLPPNAPGAQPADDSNTSGADLIALGMREEYDRISGGRNNDI